MCLRACLFKGVTGGCLNSLAHEKQGIIRAQQYHDCQQTSHPHISISFSIVSCASFFLHSRIPFFEGRPSSLLLSLLIARSISSRLWPEQLAILFLFYFNTLKLNIMKVSTSLAVAAAFAPLTMARFLDFAQPERRDHPMPAEAVPAEAVPVEGMPAHALPAEVLSGHKKIVQGGHKISKTEIIIIWANPGAGAETTTINEKVTVTQTVTKGGEAVATPAAPAQHTVTVGGPGGLVYQPEELHDIPIGDTVVFEFLSQNHTVSQSGFDKPCALLEGGMDSGFMANPNNTVSPPPQVAMQVMVDTPLCKSQTR
jgi:hypothetical protein